MDSLWALRRSDTDRRVAGLCGALARRWHIDPLLVRLITVLLALSAGVGLTLYLAGWALLPRESGPGQPPHDPPVFRLLPATRRWSHQAWTAVVVVAVVLTAVALGGAVQLGTAPALIVLGIVWWQRRREHRHGDSAPPPPAGGSVGRGASPDTPFTASAREWQQRVWQSRQPVGEPTAPVPTPPVQAAPTPPAPTSAVKSFLQYPDPVGLYGPAAPVARGATAVADRAPRRNRLLPAVVAVAVGLVLTALAVVDQVWAAVPAAAFWGAALVICGLGCLVGGFRGRARLLGGLTALLLVVALGAVAPHRVPADLAWGEQNQTYQRIGDIPAHTELGTGQMVVDLSQVAVTENRTVSYHVHRGSLQVVAPRDGRVHVEATTDLGSVQVFSETRGGTDQRYSGNHGEGRYTLFLDLRTDMGEVTVR